MEITFCLTPKDVKEYTRYVLRTRRRFWMSLLAYSLAGPSAVWIAAWLVGLSAPYRDLMTLILGGWWLAYFWSQYFPRMDAKLYPGYFDPQTLRITEQGIFRKTSTSETTWFWTAAKVESTTRHIYVFLSDAQGYSIPRRAFGDPRASERFLQTMMDARDRAHKQLLLTDGMDADA